ncbi:MAG: ABC transporter ATP-binding protein, partial [Actinomycetota bacterium]|nr:ABC transporter ATP-binding protein [Actinomycetota bacterium]
MAEPVLAVEDLRVEFPTPAGVVRAVDGVSWSVRPGETIGIVGESGSGKSVSALAVMGLVPSPGRVTSGRVLFGGRDLLPLRERDLRRVRGREVAMIFQDPLSSLNPVFKVGVQVAEAVRAHHRVGRVAARARAVELLQEVGVPDPRRRADQYPHQFSGGMRQRAMIAIALAGDPKVLLADEPTTALDVTVQAQILELLARLRRDRQMSVVFITHDMAVVAGQAERVLVMYAGRVAEVGAAEPVFSSPGHAYTLGLLQSVAHLDGVRGRPLEPIPGQPPSLVRLPPGCPFHPRCRFATESCRRDVPALTPQPGEGHAAACHEAEAVSRTRRLVATAGDAAYQRPPAQALLEVEDLVKHFPVTRGALFKHRIGSIR